MLMEKQNCEDNSAKDEIVFFCNDTSNGWLIIISKDGNDSPNGWLISISNDGFKFNREAYPNALADDFARAFVEIMERQFVVTFKKRKKEELQNPAGYHVEYGGTLRCITSDGRNVNMAEELNRLEELNKGRQQE